MNLFRLTVRNLNTIHHMGGTGVGHHRLSTAKLDLKMEYSAAEIAVITNLQRLTITNHLPPVPILSVSITTFWWRFLRQSRWTKVKVLYIITRYLPFILVAIYLCLNFIKNETPSVRGRTADFN
ncbi:hypothetical protein BD769DRAFT_1391915 [Suillus cothurnatus]|nr:hypothetical protein BD769DRAFT_1391915 [Suillus cothurnatus]